MQTLHTVVNRIDMELVSDPCISKALCMDFQAPLSQSVGSRSSICSSVMSPAAWRSSRVLSFVGRSSRLQTGVPACVSRLLITLATGLVSRAQGSQWTTPRLTCPTILSHKFLDQALCIRPGRSLSANSAKVSREKVEIPTFPRYSLEFRGSIPNRTGSAFGGRLRRSTRSLVVGMSHIA